MSIKEIKDRVKELEWKNMNCTNEEIQELIHLRSELTLKTVWNFK
jgi:hypothetical protein